MSGRFPVVDGEYLPPAGLRRRGVTIVRDCPHCRGGAHLHRGAASGVRRSSCGRRYVITVDVGDLFGGAA